MRHKTLSTHLNQALQQYVAAQSKGTKHQGELLAVNDYLKQYGPSIAGVNDKKIAPIPAARAAENKEDADEAAQGDTGADMRL